MFQLANVTGIADRKCATLATRNAHQDGEVEPDRLVNPEMYQAQPYIPQTGYQAIVDAELNEEEEKEEELVNEEPRRLIPMHTYSSRN